MSRKTAKLGTLIAVQLIVFSGAGGSELTYTPVNPSFGGNPFNSSHLISLADRQNEFTEDPNAVSAAASRGSVAGTSLADRFARSLQSRLLSSLARQVTDAIFGANPQDSGTVTFGDQTISFSRGLESISLVITDTAAGTTTEIEVPTLVVEP